MSIKQDKQYAGTHMNEKIKQLANQAQQYAECTTPQGLEWFDVFKEKFAELIVRECVDVCESMPLIGSYKTVQDATLKDAAVQIKEHFGVEP